jgi:hypothetical protein
VVGVHGAGLRFAGGRGRLAKVNSSDQHCATSLFLRIFFPKTKIHASVNPAPLRSSRRVGSRRRRLKGAADFLSLESLEPIDKAQFERRKPRISKDNWLGFPWFELGFSLDWKFQGPVKPTTR